MTFSPSKFPAGNLGDRGAREQYLRFYLDSEMTAMLPVARLTEVLTIPLGQITPIPHMPGWVMGVYNWRGEILWMVDLANLLGLTPWHQQSLTVSQQRALVLQSETGGRRDRGQMLGLVINQVEDIESCIPEKIQSSPASMGKTTIAPFLRGYWIKEEGEMVVILDDEAIIAAMPKP